MADPKTPHPVNNEEIQILRQAFYLAGISSEGAFTQDEYCISFKFNLEIRQSFIDCWGITTPIWRLGKAIEADVFEEIISTPSFSEAAAAVVGELVRIQVAKKLQEFSPNLIKS